MTATKRKLLYALVVLLFLLVIALIGFLAHVLFALRVVSKPAPVPPEQVILKHQQTGSGPISETVIEIDATLEPATGKVMQAEEVADAGIASGTDGHIPCVCEGYAPEITRRAAHANPLENQAVVSATRAVVTLTLPPKPARGDQ